MFSTAMVPYLLGEQLHSAIISAMDRPAKGRLFQNSVSGKPKWMLAPVAELAGFPLRTNTVVHVEASSLLDQGRAG
jgi:hypothetical protein